MKEYVYVGPVKSFGKVICKRWEGTTDASSYSDAKAKLTLLFKEETGRYSNAKIELSDKCLKECM